MKNEVGENVRIEEALGEGYVLMSDGSVEQGLPDDELSARQEEYERELQRQTDEEFISFQDNQELVLNSIKDFVQKYSGARTASQYAEALEDLGYKNVYGRGTKLSLSEAKTTKRGEDHLYSFFNRTMGELREYLSGEKEIPFPEDSKLVQRVLSPKG